MANRFDADAHAVMALGDCRESLKAVPDVTMELVITSPPYNIGKNYEVPTHLDKYLPALNPIVDALVRVLAQNGSLVWQVSNYVDNGEIAPLDILFYHVFKSSSIKLRN